MNSAALSFTPTPPVTPAVCIVGLGNIGSALIPLLAGVPGLTRAVLVDHDRYGAGNLGYQRISTSAVGHLKVKVQASALAACAPHLAIEACASRIEALPLGALKNCVLLSAVDSRSARQAINRVAFRLGLPWIDAALDVAGSVRARLYLPGAGADCLECAWAENDYALLEQSLPCNAAAALPAATRAPLELGAIAASLQITLLRRLLAAESDSARRELASQQWFFEMPRGWTGRYTTNPDCRFDHAAWPITPLAQRAQDLTLRAALALAGADAADAELALDGQVIVRALRCTKCRHVRVVGGRLMSRLKERPCRHCGNTLRPAGPDAFDSLSFRNARRGWLDRSLASFGLLDRDVISINVLDTAAHYELGAARGESC